MKRSSEASDDPVISRVSVEEQDGRGGDVQLEDCTILCVDVVTFLLPDDFRVLEHDTEHLWNERRATRSEDDGVRVLRDDDRRKRQE